mmetsp:Transcript_8347/g.36907  ORF Transcript_8347/g.36907 Transcript_8347/m.36907 type:complete len:297 (+) Transcript_8347:717-1607(+)
MRSRSAEEPAPELVRPLSHGDSAGEEALADELHVRHRRQGSAPRDVSAVDGQVAVSVQEGLARDPLILERYPCVIQVVTRGLGAHVPEGHPRRYPAGIPWPGTFRAKLDQERMRSLALAADDEVRHDHRFTRGQTLRDPVLARAVVGRVQQERALIRDPPRRRLNHQPGVDARELLGKCKAPELAVSLHLVERPQVFGSSELEHGPGEEVVLDREPDAESRPLLEAVIDEQPVRLEELGRFRLEVPELEERGLEEAAESRGGVVIVVRGGVEHARELGGVVCAPRNALRVLVDIRR